MCVYIYIYIKVLKHLVHVAWKIHIGCLKHQMIIKLGAICSVLITALLQSQIKSKGVMFTSAKKEDLYDMHGDSLIIQQIKLSIAQCSNGPDVERTGTSTCEVR